MTIDPQPDLGAVDELVPDDLLHLTMATEVTPVAGQVAEPLLQRGRLARFDRLVLLTLPTVGELTHTLTVEFGRDTEAAQVAFANAVDFLRRDGWRLRPAEPWETKDPTEGPVPF
jgi:hypothetical protein